MSAATAGPVVGVVGWPVAHSRSPAMHGAAFSALGLAWRYVRLPVAPRLFAETVRALPESGFRGVNVTIPHKIAALELADEADSAARASGAANTLTFADDGSIRAANTDAPGFLDSLGESPRGMRAMVLGAGGSGRAVAWALRDAGAAEVSVWNRSAARARALAEELGVRHVARPEAADLVVNATSLGLHGEDVVAELGLAALEPPSVAVDLVYNEQSALLAWGARAGATTVDGLEILVRQGARSFAIWTGVEPPLEPMRAAARAG